jgi:site-specific recombinase XerD
MATGTKGATVRRDLATLGCLCSCAVSWDYLDANPVKQFSKRHIRESAPRTAYPTADQVDRLVSQAAPMSGRMIRFLAETGMRQKEVCGLEWSQVSIQRREVRLTKTKTSSPRIVPLSDVAVGTLVGIPRHITSLYVFWHHDGQRDTTFANSFVGIARRAGVPFRCHDLRHHFASMFLEATGDIAALFGHKTISMIMRYAHMITSHLHKAMSAFDAKPGTKTGTAGTVFQHCRDQTGLDRLSVTPKMYVESMLETKREGFEPSLPISVQRFSKSTPLSGWIATRPRPRLRVVRRFPLLGEPPYTRSIDQRAGNHHATRDLRTHRRR